jgi:putative transposase
MEGTKRRGTALAVPADQQPREGFSPCMSKLARPSNPEHASVAPRTFFVTTQTAGRRHLFQTERMANLLIEVLRDQMRAKRFVVHHFVIMPDHVHLLITVPAEMSIEKAMQFIKGNLSIRAGRDFGFHGEIWQRGFSDVQVLDQLSFQQHRDYIDDNPVKAGLVNSPTEYQYGSAFLRAKKQAAAKAVQSNSP